MEALEAKKRTIEYNYYLLHVAPISLDVEGNKKVTDTNTQVELPVVYLKPGHFNKLDTFAFTHSPTSKLYGMYPASKKFIPLYHPFTLTGCHSLRTNCFHTVLYLQAILCFSIFLA